MVEFAGDIIRANIMTNILDVTAEDILALDDTVLRELIARLSEAEIKSSGYSISAVTWGGDQCAADGGIDVRVSLSSEQNVSGFIPSPNTGIQVKAEDFPRGKIKREMMPSGKLRPAIEELAKFDGAYIIVSSKGSLSDTALTDRKSTMQECIKSAGISASIYLDFYDRRRIASWVEQHPSLIAWVREKVGRPIAGWRGYAAWAHNEDDLSTDYVIEDEIKVYAPNDDVGANIVTIIDRLRHDLSLPKKSIRLTGLSGVGKTRLIQALFDTRIGTLTPALDRNAVLYTDISDSPIPHPTLMIDSMLARTEKGLIVVDNCGAELHQKLTERVQKSNSELSLATVEYDIRDDLPEGTSCYRLEPSSNDLIRTIVKRRYSTLTKQDIETIAEFSGGNARIAFALANTSNRGGELSKLEDEQLFLRLFRQKHDSNNELIAAAEVCALLYSFDGETFSEADAELTTLAMLANLTPSQLYRNVEELKRRGLVQSRGPWRAVLPQALANRLAERALQNVPKCLLISAFVDSATQRIAKSFTRRLGYLHKESIARSIASDWLNSDGRLGDVRNLDEVEQQMLYNLAPLDPKSTLNAIRRAQADTKFLLVQNRFRGRFIGLVRSIAYDPELFSQAVAALIDFAKCEAGNLNLSSAGEVLKSLFHIHLSGTMATASRL